MDARLYGLTVRCKYAIPGVTPGPPIDACDISLWFGLAPPWFDNSRDDSQIRFVSRFADDLGNPLYKSSLVGNGDYFLFEYSCGVEFVIDRFGSEIWAIWPDTLAAEDAAACLLGPIMGFVLLLRGVTCLHGCAVAIDGRAIAILGPAGAGKSTLAAAFARLGYPVLSEDIVALDAAGSEFIVRPGYPGIRLWPASVKALYGATDSLPLISPNWDKRYLDLRENSRLFQSQPLPLAAVYVLGPRQNDLGSPTIESLSSQDRLMALLENSYSACLMDKAMRRSEFDLLGRVANQVPSRWVNPSENIADLSRLCSVLLADFRSLGSSVLSA